MLRTAWVAIVAIIVTIPCASLTIAIALVRSTSPLIEPVIRFWARAIVRAAGIELRTERMETLDPKQRYILVANHHSYLDIPCVFAAVPQPIRFMAKSSLFKIPIFGWAIGRAGFIPIDRKNRRTAVKSFDLAADRIRKGNTIVIFPEEGRSRDREMRPFQRGAFLLALKSEQPIVPIAIDGTYDVLSARTLQVKPGVVTVRIGTPIATAGLSLRDKERLANESRAQIESMLTVPR
ncbi:MAG: 1-acyl-sn-glycerol-3-phosphate acyltransferase [Acidobacteria bacterium]|nr:1-acyl-sn-glycerol-3-phosphate acyltransferase [Acidobacteriota bacterium]MBV9476543.1 1-acyl-sn-glycerol-3-phosphate acyltransferase [Acidobacteriota bacterium]